MANNDADENPNPFEENPPRPGNIRQFCEAEGFTTGYYYKLRRLGLGPRERRLPGGIVQIMPEDRLAWRERMANPAPATADLIEREKQERRERTRKAAFVAVASDKHVSKRPKLQRAAK
jgi:hypothetical protein